MKAEFKVIMISVHPRTKDFGHSRLLDELREGWLVVWAETVRGTIYYVLGREIDKDSKKE